MPRKREFDGVSTFALLSALVILAVLVALASSPLPDKKIHEEPFSSVMRGESNGETGNDAVPARSLFSDL